MHRIVGHFCDPLVTTELISFWWAGSALLTNTFHPLLLNVQSALNLNVNGNLSADC